MEIYPDLTLATTIHNNLERWMEMAQSLGQEAGQVAEIVAVDDASTKPAQPSGLGSPLRLLRNETARGFCGASDQALREVKTSFALLADADITFLPGDFRGAFEAFRANPKMAWCNFQQVSLGGTPGSSVNEEIPPAWVYGLGNQVMRRWEQRSSRPATKRVPGERIRPVLISHSSCALVRMEAFRDVGGFDLRYWQCLSDNDLCMRLGKAGWQVGVDEGYTVRHDGVGGRTGGARRVYDLYRGSLLFYETHRPGSRFYLRPLLALRHALEGAVLAVRPKSGEDHLRPGFRFHLAEQALQGYPRSQQP